MLYPYFVSIRIGAWRVDSDPNAPVKNLATLQDRLCSYYAFEFYPEDMDGGIAIDRKFYQAKKGHFSLCKPGQSERMVIPNRCYYFTINTQDAALKQSLDNLPTYGFHPEMDTILSLCKKMTQVRETTHMHARLEVEGYICQVLSMLMRQTYTIADRTDFHISRHQAALMKADRYLRGNIHENVDLDKLAKDSGLHPTYFHKLFTAAFGKTPMQQLNDYRIGNATVYLINTPRSIAEVAQKCGFSSPNYFTVKFKEATGLSPTQFRKQAKKANK